MTSTAAATPPRQGKRQGKEPWLERHFRLVFGTVTLLVLAIAWQLLAALNILDPAFVSMPSRIIATWYQYFVHGTGLSDVAVTGSEFLLGLALSIVIGVPLGLLMGYYQVVNALFDPIIALLYAIPFVALAPLFVIWFGIGMASKVALTLIAILPIAITTSGGVQTVERSLLSVARVYKASSFQIFRTLILPGTIPSIVAGIRLGTGFALLGAVTAELIVSTAGVGYMIRDASLTIKTDQLFAGVVLVSLAGHLISTLLRSLERRLDAWRL